MKTSTGTLFVENGLVGGRGASTFEALCSRCTRGLVYRRGAHEKGDAEHVTVVCGWVSRRVPPDIVECTKFSDVREMTIETMESLALCVDSREGIDDGSYV